MSEQNGGQDVTRFEPSPRWVRAVFNNVAVADSKRAVLVWEPRRLPVYCFPAEDVRADLLRAVDERVVAGGGRATVQTIQVGERSAERAAWSYAEPPPGAQALAGYVGLTWNAMDAWYEEDDEVFVHARDPHHRVDVLRSSRHVRVIVLGETVADTQRPSLLFETGLPTRYYIPRQDVRSELLLPSDTTTQCPYKGVATYHSVRIGNRLVRDLVWTYQYPIPECAKIEGLLCFYDEQVDAVIVDGQEMPKVRTPWSRPPTIETLE
jgi:uncharacterized protein (DUF427 family)